MTAPTPPPAEEAVQAAAVTALPTQDTIDPAYFVPQGTRDNYLTIIRDTAATRGQEPDAVRSELVDKFRELHDRQPLDGYDHLSAWLASADLSTLGGPSGMQVLAARTLESARRDPYQAVVGDQALVEQGVLSQQRADADVAAAAVAPALDPSFGLVANTGPLPAGDASALVDPAVAEQQQAAKEQTDSSGNVDEEKVAPSSPPPSPSSSDSSSSTSSAGKTDKSSAKTGESS